MILMWISILSIHYLFENLYLYNKILKYVDIETLKLIIYSIISIHIVSIIMSIISSLEFRYFAYFIISLVYYFAMINVILVSYWNYQQLPGVTNKKFYIYDLISIIYWVIVIIALI